MTLPPPSPGDPAHRSGILDDPGTARIWDFGLAPYGRILALQDRLHEARKRDSIPDVWLAGEHPAVVTQGVRAKPSDLRDGAPLPGPVVQVDRGGMTTLHSPGQWIVYPVVKLRAGALGAGSFARALLAFLRQWIRETYGVESEMPEGRPGLYIGGRKLLSVGVSARGGVTRHGAALNMANDPSLWRAIVACGEPETRPVTLSELLGREVRPGPEAFASLAAAIRAGWGYREALAGKAEFPETEDTIPPLPTSAPPSRTAALTEAPS